MVIPVSWIDQAWLLPCQPPALPPLCLMHVLSRSELSRGDRGMGVVSPCLRIFPFRTRRQNPVIAVRRLVAASFCQLAL
jgi:hypothetical protein